MGVLQKLTEVLTGKESFVLTPEFQEIVETVEKTNHNLFITGKAGSGKSTLIEYLRTQSKKKIVVLAPTGLSAITVRGQTIHSFFKLPPRLITKDAIAKTIYNSRLYKDIDTIIIDEISMVRADIIDGIDYFLRLHGKTKHEPFGGTQMIFVGDLYQLPPVLRREEMPVFQQLYETPYFFSADAFHSRDFLLYELSHIFRQKDAIFITLLNAIRTGNVTSETLTLVNNRLQTAPIDHNRYITLTTTNAVSQAINSSQLHKINSPEYTYQAKIEGEFPTEDRSLPIELVLTLKKGARVMFVKNDKGRLYVNGTLGTIHELTPESIKVKIDEAGKEELVDVLPEKWENIRYSIDPESGELKEKVLGTLEQYPLRLAWAITIHKSQGQTFDNVHIDFSHSPFAHGQTYVALSRCRTLEGILLSKKIYLNDVIVDERIIEFARKF